MIIERTGHKLVQLTRDEILVLYDCLECFTIYERQIEEIKSVLENFPNSVLAKGNEQKLKELNRLFAVHSLLRSKFDELSEV